MNNCFFLTLSHRRFLFSVISLLFSGLAAHAAAFDIPAQAAPAALDLFIKQSGAQVVYLQADVKDARTKALKGDYMPAAALEILLKDTGLSFSERKAGQFSVGRVPAKKTGSIKGSLVGEEGTGLAGVLITVRETGQSAETDRFGAYFFPEMAAGNYMLVATASSGYRPLHITDVALKAGGELTLDRQQMSKPLGAVTLLDPIVARANAVTELEKIEVIGSKGRPFDGGNMDIPRTVNDAQPRFIFDAKTIDQSGAVDIGEFLQQRLTMNTIAQSNATSSANVNGNASSINLRGVGTNKTLILVNGRRLPGTNLGTDADGQPDINGIPMGAIDRIEVLPSSASGIYGGSAIGGVVNVILKSNYSGGELKLSYDRHFGANDPKRTASFNYGIGLEGGKTQITLAASWSDSKPFLLQDAADIFRAYVATINGRDPNFIGSTTLPWLGSLPNIAPSSSSATTLVFRNGVSLGSRNTYVPAGTSGSTSAANLQAGLLANAGRWIMDLPLSTQPSTGLLRPIVAPVERRSFQAGIRRQMLSWLELTADYFSAENRTDHIINATTTFTVPAAAPTNPFTTAVRLRVPTALDTPIKTRSRTSSGSLGLLAKLPANWIANLDYTRAENRYSHQQSSGNDDVAMAADLLSGALNPFVDTLQFPLSLAKYFVPRVFDGSTQSQSFALRAAGPLPSLPWGQPNLTVGLERRLAHTPVNRRELVFPITVASNEHVRFFERDSKADSAYAEAMVPLVKTGWLPGLHSLEAQVAARREQLEQDTGTLSSTTLYNRTPPTVSYSGTTLNGQPYFSKADYTSNNYTLGLKYQPVKEVTLRASRATAFLPPTPTQLLENPTPTLNRSVNDPNFPGTTTTGVTFVTGGNPNVAPQSSRSLNLGLIWEPTASWLRGWRFNAEYYKIQQYDAITTPSAQLIVSNPATFPGRVTRDATGQITQVDTTQVNLYYRETEGWDLSADYNVATRAGRFSFRAVQSIILHLKNQIALGAPLTDAVGYNETENGAPKYKANASLNWEWRQLTVGWTTRYSGSYGVFGSAGSPLSVQNTNGAAFDASYTVVAGSATIPSQTYHDLFLSYRFDRDRSEAGTRLADRLLKGVSVQLNIRNVFDKVAPLDPFYYLYMSPYGGGASGAASYMLSVRKKF
jgi:outer membrane receptor protein involved in Fe transport